jgi:hypothetical protein
MVGCYNFLREEIVFSNGLKLIMAKHVMSTKNLEILRVYSMTSNVNCIIGDAPEVFELAGLEYIGSHLEKYDAVDAMRCYGSGSYKEMEYMLVTKRKLPNVYQICVQYKAWRESGAVKKMYQNAKRFWDFINLSNRVLLRRKILPLQMWQWQTISLTHMANVIKQTTKETNYNDCLLVYLLKCWTLSGKQRGTAGNNLSFPTDLKRISRASNESIQYIKSGVDAFIKFIKHARSTLDILPFNGKHKEHQYIPKDALRWTLNAFGTYWEEWGKETHDDFFFSENSHRTSNEKQTQACLTRALFFYLFEYESMKVNQLRQVGSVKGDSRLLIVTEKKI